MATDFGCIPTDPVGFVSKFYLIGLSLIGGIGALAIMYGGYTLLMSQGNPTQIMKGKRYIFAAITGILLAVFGYVFIKFSLVDLLHIPGFGG